MGALDFVKILVQLQILLVVAALDKLKRKAIKEYNQLVHGLYKGHKEDYYTLMNEISFIELHSELDNKQMLLEFYLNYGL